MRTHFLASLVVAAAATAVGAQTTTPAPPPSGQTTAPKADETKSFLIGCVQADDAGANKFTLSDKTAGATYRLSGTSVKAYVGKRVRIVGGLLPSPNLAAQAGAVDPTRAAMATAGGNQPGMGTGSVQLPEFHVSQVRPLTGSCSPP